MSQTDRFVVGLLIAMVVALAVIVIVARIRRKADSKFLDDRQTRSTRTSTITCASVSGVSMRRAERSSSNSCAEKRSRLSGDALRRPAPGRIRATDHVGGMMVGIMRRRKRAEAHIPARKKIDFGQCSFCDRPAIVRVNDSGACGGHIDLVVRAARELRERARRAFMRHNNGEVAS